MSEINIQVEAYGGVTRFLPAEAIHLKMESPIQIEQVLTQIIKNYPQAESAISLCACAIGEDIISRQNTLDWDCTLVLLSPVAGG
ncbi:MoaD/ThiS family protein [Acinetobacter sp. ANC 3781]|uniref:MoaD/ThiS family protein n=1 Tax=Acinetobacter sp. ANC 3781 TaxID=2529835 RepID=UPI00103F3FBD|nr:MoaD/ThiS family protein [Acinetobacter sp. ANC 3781]TCB70836.1 MoaD/ThiS family protein [Acinetobacter sp. ANC 3781]